MASSEDFVRYVVEQGGNGVVAKKMFGEYALYLDDKVVALVCDDTLFVKPTDAGRALVAGRDAAVGDAPPYPGAKPHLVICDVLDDRKSFRRLLIATAAALPQPKPKPKKAAVKKVAVDKAAVKQAAAEKAFVKKAVVKKATKR